MAESILLRYTTIKGLDIESMLNKTFEVHLRDKRLDIYI